MSLLKKNVLNIADLRELARKRLTKALFDFCDKGSEDQVNMSANRTALDNIKLMPRMLRDISGRDPSITLFEKEHALPLIITITAYLAGAWLLQRARRVWPLLAWSFAGVIALSAASMVLRSDDALYELFVRTASGVTTGQHLAGVGVAF